MKNTISLQKHSSHTIRLFIIHFVFFTGCASVYRGPGPNFYLNEKVAIENEKKKFEVRPDWFGQMQMGEVNYQAESVLPIIREVSIVGYDDILTGKKFSTLGTVGIILGSIGFSGSYIDSKNEKEWMRVLGSIFFAGGLGLEILGSYKINGGVEQYNYDLRRGFATDRTQSQGFISDSIKAVNVSFPLELKW